ncbi:MAG: GNAT family N-acetyltransferase [Candidatus Gottesmanbacteria bacterium]|nr:GNAT family N-acetyltransferase [Candidatus Gottesmanbacteria bacterium]
MESCEYLLIQDPTQSTIAPYSEKMNELGKKFYATLDSSDEPMENLTARISEYKTLVLLLDKDIPDSRNQVIGFALLTALGNSNEIDLSAAYIDESHRKRGLAGKMFDKLIEEARRMGSQTIVATVGINAMGIVDKMLEQRGFIASNNGLGDYYLRLK